MERLTIWCARNPIKVRVLLVFVHLLITVTAMVLGGLMFISDVELPSGVNYVLLGIFSLALLTYPLKNGMNSLFRQDFKKRQRSDLFMTLTYAFIIVVSFNQFLYTPANLNISPAGSPGSMLIVNKGKSGIKKKETRKSWKPSKRAFKKQVRAQVKKIKKRFKKNPDASNNVGKGFAIFGTVMLILLLAFIVVIGSCALACNGYSFFSAIVLLGGVAGIVLMAIGLFKVIKSKFQKVPVEGNSTS